MTVIVQQQQWTNSPAPRYKVRVVEELWKTIILHCGKQTHAVQLIQYNCQCPTEEWSCPVLIQVQSQGSFSGWICMFDIVCSFVLSVIIK